jgi:uncharacterized pyridoxal phosphate-dependent enzyme
MGVLEELGVRPFLNAYRPLTRLGGSVLPEPVIAAMAEVARVSVDLRDMQRRVGCAIARLTRNEAAYVSCGAVSGITLAVAASIAGTDPELRRRLPHTGGMKNEVLMHACERGYKGDAGVQNAGGVAVEVGGPPGATRADFERAISERTAAILSVPSGLGGAVPTPELAGVSRAYGIPLLVDAAFLVPPRETFWRYTQAGAACVIVSGGKGVGGPQTTGLILGRRYFIEQCAYHGAPNDYIGRGMKVGKEELAGIYAAVKLLMATDDAKTAARHNRQLRYLERHLSAVSGVSVKRVSGPQGLMVSWHASRGSAVEMRDRLLAAEPPVYCEPCAGGLSITPECLEDGAEATVAAQLTRVLTEDPAAAGP